VLPSAETWTWKARAYAASHWRTTCVIVAVAPRSTWIHSLLVNALPHRVPVSPSTALAATNPPSVPSVVQFQ